MKEGLPGISATEAGGVCGGVVVRSPSVGDLISIPTSNVTIIREEGGRGGGGRRGSVGPASSEGLSAGCVLAPLLNLETSIRVFLSIQPECYDEKKKQKQTPNRLISLVQAP